MIACKLQKLHTGQFRPLNTCRAKPNNKYYSMYRHTARKKKPSTSAGPAHSDHYCTRSSEGPTLAPAVSQSSQQGRPMYYSRVWDCEAAAVRAEGQGAGRASPPDAVRAHLPNLCRQEVGELSRLWSRAGQRSVFSPWASLAAVAAHVLKDLHRRRQRRHIDF